MGTDGSSDHHAQAAQEDHHETPSRNGIVGEQDAAASDAAMRLATTVAVPAALKAAIDLGVFEILAKARGAGKSLTAKDIASQVLRPDSGGLSVINDRYLERILRLLATENVVRESAVTPASANSSSSTERFYALQPVGTYFVMNDEDAASLAPLIIMSQDRDFIEPMHHLSATVLDDSTDNFRKAHGESLFQYASHNPGFDKLFNAGMAHQSRLYMQAVLRAYHGFQDGKCLVDVGGGTGSSLALIAAKYPHIRGINYDLPHVVAASPAYPGIARSCTRFSPSRRLSTSLWPYHSTRASATHYCQFPNVSQGWSTSVETCLRAYRLVIPSSWRFWISSSCVVVLLLLLLTVV